MNFDFDKIKKLAELAAENDLAEVTVSEGEQSITIKTAAAFPGSYQTAPAYMLPGGSQGGLPALPQQSTYQAPPAEASASTATAEEDASLHTVNSPMVGTFYSASSPDSPAFVKVGDTVTVGQTLCILEAMKQMNELESDAAGTVVEILGKNGEPVEYGQALFKLRP